MDVEYNVSDSCSCNLDYSPSTITKSRSRSTESNVMADATVVHGTLLQFVYMCLHHSTGYFRRIDGRPLDIYTITGPHEQGVVCDPYNGVVWEPYNWQADPPLPPRIRPLLHNCSRCRQRRRQTIERGLAISRECSEMTRHVELRMRDYYLEDRILIDLAAGRELEGVEERVERNLRENGRLANDFDNRNGYGYNASFIYNYNFNYNHEFAHEGPDSPRRQMEELRRRIRSQQRTAWRRVLYLFVSEDQRFVRQTPNLQL